MWVQLKNNNNTLKVCLYFRVVAHMLYEKVKIKTRTSESISESFRSDIQVKQGGLRSG